MQQFTIETNHAGQRFDKFLHKYMPNAGSSFLYKMLRKKNITLNHKKAEGKEILNMGDVVCFYFSDETYEKFTGRDVSNNMDIQKNLKDNISQNIRTSAVSEYEKAYRAFSNMNIQVIYEDSHVLILNKPAGILTQKAQNDDISLNEWMIGYLLKKGKISEDELTLFKPSVCNRLDRNTSGLVLCGISLKGSQTLSKMVHDRSIHKFYRTICYGQLTEKVILNGSLIKNEKTNTVIVSKEGNNIQTIYEPITVLKEHSTYLEVELITGKTHQIRAHLASIGHPLMGDHKYGNKNYNKLATQKYKQNHQLLHAYRVEFPYIAGELSGLSNQIITAPFPAKFKMILEDLR